ncbi:hypothetical protein [Streptomyces sp. NBC_01601]|uniref:hypothetical protein n=1 Tax=Streptomyces sp. NBC_01601 TaxID=2975892 RepID=UPI002E294C07|nr:hypothetical protein [Streptomyces sp. NBC_01601]
MQKIHEVDVRPAEAVQEVLTRAVQITVTHNAPGHGMDCTCDLDALEVVEQLATYAADQA